MKRFVKIITSLALCLITALSVGSLAACGNSATTFEICDDVSNAARAFQLLEAKGVISKETEGDNFPVKEDGSLNFADTQKSWENKAKTVKVTLVAENPKYKPMVYTKKQGKSVRILGKAVSFTTKL